MTQIAVPILVENVDDALTAGQRAAAAGADLIEWRIDRFDDAAGLRELVERSPLPCIVTCRSEREGGGFVGDGAALQARLQPAIDAEPPAAYVDVELATWKREPAVKAIPADRPGLILSTHDFETRPSDLLRRVADMAGDERCRVVKLAWRARSLRDNVEALEIARQQVKPTIALCMGEAGLPSRVLAKKFGALLTFAALDDAAGTAPGQPTIAELKGLYRWDRLGPETRVYGVIGYPVGHSMSPPIHNAGFDAAGVDGVYLPMPIPPEYEHFKATVLTWLDCAPLHFRGASVTIPHKENLLRFVREQDGEIEPLAEEIGAANTLTVRDDGSLYASNTDYAAALDAVCDTLGIGRDALAGRRVAVLGAGGAARAIVAGFARHGATVVVYNRTRERAEELVTAFHGKTGQVVAADPAMLPESDCAVIINCTPLGMHPNVDATPVEQAPAWGPGTVVFDTIYNPIETRLLREAKAAGCATISGIEMFVRQGAAQFTLWTGEDAPTDVFERVLRERLA